MSEQQPTVRPDWPPVNEKRVRASVAQGLDVCQSTDCGRTAVTVLDATVNEQRVISPVCDTHKASRYGKHLQWYRVQP